MPADTIQDPQTIRSDAPAAATSIRRICIVLNPGSGKQGETGLDRPVREFAEAKDHVTLCEVSKSEPLPELARRVASEDHDVVVAAGGDGTIGAVAEALIAEQSRAALGVLPLGTFNFFARALELPTEIDAALKVLEEGEPRPMAVGEVNGSVFLNNASLGIYPAILAQREKVYKRWGRSRLAAYWSVILTLIGFRRARTLRVTVDGVERRRRSPLIFIANSAYQLEEYDLEGADQIRAGQFAVFLAPDVGRWGLMRFAILLLGRSVKRHRDIEVLHGTDIQIEGAGSHLVARDGERERMKPPFRFQRKADALQVMVPKGADGAPLVNDGGAA